MREKHLWLIVRRGLRKCPFTRSRGAEMGRCKPPLKGLSRCSHQQSQQGVCLVLSGLSPARAAKGMLWRETMEVEADREGVGSMGGLSPALKVLPL